MWERLLSAVAFGAGVEGNGAVLDPADEGFDLFGGEDFFDGVEASGELCLGEDAVNF